MKLLNAKLDCIYSKLITPNSVTLIYYQLYAQKLLFKVTLKPHSRTISKIPVDKSRETSIPRQIIQKCEFPETLSVSENSMAYGNQIKTYL